MNWKRIIATLIDLVIISIIISPFFAICIWDGHVNLIVFVFSLLITLLLCKDNMNGQSIGKRVMKIRIVNNGSERTPKNSSLILRNIIGLLLFPIEIILTLLNHKKKRIGDYLFGTTVIDSDYNTNFFVKSIHLVDFFLCLALIFLIALVVITRSTTLSMNIQTAFIK